MSDSKTQGVMEAMIQKIAEVLQIDSSSSLGVADTTDYVSWFSPGIPVNAESLSYLNKGFSNATADTFRHAAEFSRLLNTIPKQGALIDSGVQQTVFSTDSSLLWDVYLSTLKFSEVASGDLTQEQKDKIAKFRKLLVTTKTEKNIVTDEVVTSLVDGPVAEAYKKYQAQYYTALVEYNNLRLNALNEETPTAAQQWALNSKALEAKVRSASDDFVTKGYKNEYEQMNAYIDQVTQKDLTLYKADLLTDVQNAALRDATSNKDFYPTFLLPGNALSETQGWTNFTFSHSKESSYSKTKTHGWDVSSQFRLGLFRVNSTSSGQKEDTVLETNLHMVDFEFDIIQVPISRPWFDPAFISSRAWRFSRLSPLSELSNGGNPPSGSMTGYPVTAVFVRNVRITSKDESTRKQLNALTTNNSVTGGWGPFSVTAKYSYGRREEKNDIEQTAQGINIKGIQLIAFKCHSLSKKTPDSLADITQWS